MDKISLFDLIAPVVEEIIKDIAWSDAPSYSDMHKVGRFAGAWLIGIWDDYVYLRSSLRSFKAADPNFIDELKKHLILSYNDIIKFTSKYK